MSVPITTHTKWHTNPAFPDLAGAHVIETILNYSKPAGGPYYEVHNTALLSVGPIQLYIPYDGTTVTEYCDGKASQFNFTAHFCSNNVTAAGATLHMLHLGDAETVGKFLGGKNFTTCKALGVKGGTAPPTAPSTTAGSGPGSTGGAGGGSSGGSSSSSSVAGAAMYTAAFGAGGAGYGGCVVGVSWGGIGWVASQCGCRIMLLIEADSKIMFDSHMLLASLTSGTCLHRLNRHMLGRSRPLDWQNTM